MKRAWAFQERTLAARTLHFTKTEIFYECQHGQLVCKTPVCETFPEGIPFEFVTQAMLANKRPLTDKDWEEITSLYNTCDLTFPEDKLVAMSGVAKRMQRTRDDQYVAGMWRSNLVTNLCWLADIRGQKRKQNAKYIAPSWSFLSVSSPIRGTGTLHLGSPSLIDILDTQVILAGPDPFGALLEAKLILGCRILLTVQHDYTSGFYAVKHKEDLVVCGVQLDYTPDLETSECKEIFALPTHALVGGGSNILFLERTGQDKGTYWRIGFSMAYTPQWNGFTDCIQDPT